MNVLLIGSGGREHALAWKIAQSPRLTRLVVAPGNPGIAAICEVRAIPVTDTAGIVALAREIDAHLVVVGPEAALEKGVADRLAEIGIPCFGPTLAAARLETSKVFLKAFAERHQLATARHQSFSDLAGAKAALGDFTPPFVIKADGLAAGKGVVIAADKTDAVGALEAMFGGQFGDAGARVVIEEFMAGEEASLFALSDGETTMVFGGAQDHKRAYDGDLGPNTGGMGAFAPTPLLNDLTAEAASLALVEPTVKGMAAEGFPFRGVLYAGLMIQEGRPRLVEFNARFGDPECQVLMLRLKSDVLVYLSAAANGGLKGLEPPEWADEAVICVVLAARGYPEAPEKGSVIRGLAEGDFGDNVVIFHAGTALNPKGELIAAGGRVLNVCARGENLEVARARAYAAIENIDWPDGFHRSDIGWRGLQRE